MIDTISKSMLKKWQGTAAVIGVDWGDSGKGRLIDDLAQNAHVVARFNGGSNTGHTVKNQYGKFALHIIPSGIFNPHVLNIIGRGVAVDLESLCDDETGQLKRAGISLKNLKIDEQATLTMPWHKMRDGLREVYRHTKIDTTKRGVGPTYADRIERVGIRVKDLYQRNFAKILRDEIAFQNKFFKFKLSYQKIHSNLKKYASFIKPFVTQTIPIIQKSIGNKNVLFEGAQGYFLDIDTGTYPFVTSSNTGVVGIWRCFDIHPAKIDQVIGITKAYTTRVGAGPMPTAIEGPNIRNRIIEKGAEIGTTSGRVRHPGWLDLVLLKAACNNNRVNDLAVTKLDVLTGFKFVKICVDYKLNGKSRTYLSGDGDFLEKVKPVYEELPGWDEDLSKIRKLAHLPKNARRFIKRVEELAKVPVNFIGVGPERSQAIYV